MGSIDLLNKGFYLKIKKRLNKIRIHCLKSSLTKPKTNELIFLYKWLAKFKNINMNEIESWDPLTKVLRLAYNATHMLSGPKHPVKSFYKTIVLDKLIGRLPFSCW